MHVSSDVRARVLPQSCPRVKTFHPCPANIPARRRGPSLRSRRGAEPTWIPSPTAPRPSATLPVCRLEKRGQCRHGAKCRSFVSQSTGFLHDDSPLLGNGEVDSGGARLGEGPACLGQSRARRPNSSPRHRSPAPLLQLSLQSITAQPASPIATTSPSPTIVRVASSDLPCSFARALPSAGGTRWTSRTGKLT